MLLEPVEFLWGDEDRRGLTVLSDDDGALLFVKLSKDLGSLSLEASEGNNVLGDLYGSHEGLLWYRIQT